MEPQSQTDPKNAFERGADAVNLPMAIAGAALGAAFGGGVWFAIEYFASYQIGFVAILCGLAAAFGAVKLGKGHGFQIGVIAAAFGLLGVVGGSYGSFVAQKAKAKDQLRAEVEKYPGFMELSADEQEQALALGQTAIDEIGYVEYMKNDTKQLTWMAIFGVFGLAYGFKLGNDGIGGNAPSPDLDTPA